MGKVRLGIIGCGKVTRRQHLPVLAHDKRVKITALCDTDVEAARSIAARFDISCPIYEKPEDIFLCDEVDVVDICTPGNMHFVMASQALEAGKHVLVEKPPVQKTSDALDLINCAKERKLKIGTVFNNRYRDILVQLRKKIGEGLLGKIVKVRVLHHANLVYGDSPWLWDESKSKYLVYEFGIHHFDFVVSLFGEHEEILSLVPIYQPSIQQTTEIQVTVKFRNGSIAHFIISQDSTRHSTYRTVIDVYGTAMDAHVRFFPPLIRLSSGIDHPVDILFSEIGSMAKLGRLLLTRRWGDYQNSGHRISLTQFVGWILEENDYAFSLEKVLPTLRLLDDISEGIPSYR